MQWLHTAAEPPQARRRRIDLHPVLLRAGALPRPDKLRASRERLAKLHEAPSSRQLRHVEPPGLASSTCSGTRLENEGERGDDHASGGHIDRSNAVLNVPAARRRGAQPQQVAQLAFSMTA